MLNGLNVGPDWVVPNVDHYFNLSPMGSVVNLNGVANWSHLINSLRVFYRRRSAVTYIDSDARHRKGPRRRWLLGDVTVELFALEVPPNGVEGCLGTAEKMQVLISCDDIMFLFFHQSSFVPFQAQTDTTGWPRCPWWRRPGQRFSNPLDYVLERDKKKILFTSLSNQYN